MSGSPRFDIRIIPETEGLTVDMRRGAWSPLIRRVFKIQILGTRLIQDSEKIQLESLGLIADIVSHRGKLLADMDPGDLEWLNEGKSVVREIIVGVKRKNLPQIIIEVDVSGYISKTDLPKPTVRLPYSISVLCQLMTEIPIPEHHIGVRTPR